MNKMEQLTKVIKAFEAKKEHNLLDYMMLITTVHDSLKQGSGLMWDQVKECVMNALYGEGQWGSYEDKGPHWSDKPITDKSSDPI